MFDLNRERVCHIIEHIRTENHIDDKEATGQKIRKMLQVVHDDRGSKFDLFKFRGRKLSSYIPDGWIERIARTVEAEIYNTLHDERTYTNISTLYENMKLEFFQNLRHDE